MTYDSRPGDLTSTKVTRVIDMKLPLYWLISVAAIFVSGGFAMYYKLENQSEAIKSVQGDIKDVKISVQAGNQATATVQGEIAILRFRVENLEAEKRQGRAQ